MSKKETVKEEKTKAPKKKKRHIGLKILISFLIIFLVLPLTFILGFLVTWKPGADLSNVQKINDLKEVINDELYESLNYTTDADCPRVELKLGEDELNSVLGLVRKQYFPTDVQQYIPQLYCQVDGKEYTFGIDAKYSIIQTSVKVKTEIIEKGDNIIFRLKTIQLGHVPLLNFIEDALLKLGTKYFSDEQLNNFFSGFGIHINSDLEHGEITYDRHTFINDLVNIISGKKENNEDAPIDLMSILIELVQLEELFDPVTSDGLGVKVYLDSKQPKEEYGYSLIHYPEKIGGPDKYAREYLKFDDARGYTLNIINDPANISTLSETDIPNLFNFFVFGFDESYKDVCEKVTDWSSVSEIITDGNYADYEGSPYRVNAKTEGDTFITGLEQSIKDKLDSDILIDKFCHDTAALQKLADIGSATIELGELCQIPAKPLRAFCSQLNIVGFNKPIFKKIRISETHTENYGINYLGLKDLDFKFNGVDAANKMDAYVTLDVNGQDTFITLDTTLQSPSDAGKIAFKLNDAYLGQIPTSKEAEGLQAAIIELIKDKTATSGDTHPLFSFDDNNCLIIDIAGRLPSGSTSIFNEGGIDIELTLPPPISSTKSVNIVATLIPEIVSSPANDGEYVLSLGADVTAKVKNQ
ncbi:MAG: hypothetical protein MJ206_02685 [Bacilli bacterium]|nr:hypothetical protein [Bacilli bacterium]